MSLGYASPDPDRIIDYWLGGNAARVVDLGAAIMLERLIPNAPMLVRSVLRACQTATLRAGASGVRQFLVLDAGLPTFGHVHGIAPHAHTLYLDRQPQNVTTAAQITGDLSYVQVDGYTPETLPQVLARHAALLNRRERVCILAPRLLFLDKPETIQPLLTHLYSWAAPGSSIVLLSARSDAKTNPTMLERVLAQYALMGMDVQTHSLAELNELVCPWPAGGNEWMSLIQYMRTYTLRTGALLPPSSGPLLSEQTTAVEAAVMVLSHLQKPTA